MMKTRLFIWLIIEAALATVFVGSCTKIQDPEDDGWTELNSDRPISFASGVTTKATSDLPNNTYFGVFAFMQNGIIGSYTGAWADLATKHWTPNFMFNQKVNFKNSNYTYSPLRYWPPSSENTITFWAYHPFDSNLGFLAANSTTESYKKTSVGLPDISFSTDGRKDLLVADLVPDQSRSTTFDPVAFTFHHALCKIDFKVQKMDDPNDDYTVTLKSISFTNIYNEGILRNTGSRANWNWYLATSHTSSLPVFTGSVPVYTTESSIISDAYAIVVPQTFASGTSARIRVEYELSWTGSGTPRTNVSLCTLTGSWAINQHYVYTLRITPGMPIEFEVEWTEWGDANNYHLTS